MSIVWDIRHYPSLSSTQDAVHVAAQDGAAEGLVIRAGEQTQGRGRHGRAWVSPPGNLSLSLLLRPLCPAGEIGRLSLAVGLACGLAIRDAIGERAALSLKWPNDVLIGGGKCAGILLETDLRGATVEALILGVGVNVRAAPPDLGTALAAHSDTPPDAEKVQDAFLARMAQCYALWQAADFERIRREWLVLAHRKGEHISVKVGSDVYHGTFQNIDDFGNLLLHDPRLGLKTIAAGEIYGQESH